MINDLPDNILTWAFFVTYFAGGFMAMLSYLIFRMPVINAIRAMALLFIVSIIGLTISTILHIKSIKRKSK